MDAFRENNFSPYANCKRAEIGEACIAVNFAKTYFTGAFPEYWLYGLGLLFVLVTLFLPKGLLGVALGSSEPKPREMVSVDAVEEGAEP